MSCHHLQQYFWYILKAACFIAFIIQISASIHSQLAPQDTVAKTVRTDLKNVDFPVAFKICMKPSFNSVELEKVGYELPYFYFSGRSKYDKNLLTWGSMGIHGWAGHTEEGGVFSNVTDVQNRIFNDYHSAIIGIGIYTDKVFVKNTDWRN